MVLNYLKEQFGYELKTRTRIAASNAWTSWVFLSANYKYSLELIV